MRYSDALHAVVKQCEIAQTACVANDNAKSRFVWNDKKKRDVVASNLYGEQASVHASAFRCCF